MPTASAERNLLFGLLAVQLDFITKEDLVAATRAWLVDKTQLLGDILCDQEKLSAERLQLLAALTKEHVRQHGNDPAQSLAALSSIDRTLSQQLAALPDADVMGTAMQLCANWPQTPPLDASETIAQAPAAGASAGRYRIVKPHARGGLGEVFVAEDTELGRQVALKQIQDRHADDQTSRGRFVLEAEVTGGLEHPGIVPVYGLGSYADGRPYYAMRFIKGDNLKDAIIKFHADAPRFDSLSFRELLGRFVDVCQAVAYAHSRGVLHRDLKPGNIMLGKYGETLVVDWGLAKAVAHLDSAGDGDGTLKPQSGGDSSATAAGHALGTPAYMPPEQAAGDWDRLGPASDVYSLGATLYELLTGKPPFEVRLIDIVLEDVRNGRFRSPRSLVPTVPHGLQAICLKAMALKPEERYSSAQLLAADMERWLADEPVSVWREPVGALIRRWVRKHARLTTGIAVTLTLGVIGLSAIAWQREQARAAVAKEQVETAKERDRAEDEKRIAQSVRDFLQNKLLVLADTRTQANKLLATGHSSSEATLDPPISVLLGRAAAELTPEKIESRFPSQPLVQAEILQTIGDTYRGIGKYPVAISHLERARDLRVLKLGADHPDTLATLQSLAVAHYASGKLPEAIQLFENVRNARTIKLGPDHPDTLMTLDNLAVAYWAFGKLPEAIRLYEEVRDARKIKLGVNHHDTLLTLNNLAAAYQDTGKLPEAIRLYEEVRESFVAKLGADHPDTLLVLHNLAWAYHASGNFSEAIRLLEPVRDLCVAKFGADHPETLTTLHNLAMAYRQSGRISEAIRLFEQVRDAKLVKLGPDHPDTLVTLSNLAGVYAESDKLPEAIRIYEQVRDAQQIKLGPDHPSTLTTLHNLAIAYQNSGRLPEATRLFEQVRDIKIKKLGPDHVDTLATLNNLAVIYRATGKLPEAIQIYEQVRDSLVAKLGADHPDTLTTIAGLAIAYRAAGRLADALAGFEQAASGIEKRQFKHQHAGQILAATVSCNEQAKEFEKAESWRRKWLAQVREQSGAESTTYAAELAGLGDNLIQQKKYADAESVLRACLAIREKYESDVWTTSYATSSFGAALAGQKKYAEAEPHLLQGYEGLKHRADKIPAQAKAQLPEAGGRLIRLYDDWGKPEEVAKWKKELEELKKVAAASPPPEPPKP